MVLAALSARFQSLPPPPTNWALLVLILGPCGSLQWTLLWSWEFLLLLPQPQEVFSISGLRLYFPDIELWVVQSVTLSTSCSFAHSTPPSATSLGPPATALPWVLSTPPTGLDECSTLSDWLLDFHQFDFQQFWLFFVFKLLLSFFWLCEEAQCVYLCLHLVQKS